MMARLLQGYELRFSFNVAGTYLIVGGRTRLLTHSQSRRLFEAIC